MANKKMVINSGISQVLESNELQNYIENSTARLNATGWSTYATSSASATPSNFGGTPNGAFTFARNTSSPIGANSDFLLTKDANNRQGHGVYYEFTPVAGDLTSVQTVSFRFKNSSAYLDGDLRVYLVTTATNFAGTLTVVEATVRDLVGFTGTGANTYIGTVQVPVDAVAARLCIHVAGTNASAWTTNLTDISVGKNAYTQSGYSIEARFSTNVAQSVANSGDILIDFEDKEYDNSGAVTTGASWKFTAPVSGYYDVEALITFDTGFTYAAGNRILLKLYKNGSAYSNLGREAIETAVSNLIIAAGGADTIYLNKGDYIDIRVANNRTAGATTLLAANSDNHISVSLASEEKSSIISSGLTAARFTTNTALSVANTGDTLVDFEDKDFDTTGSVTVGGSWKFTSPKSAYYSIDAQVSFTGAVYTDTNRGILKLYKNGSVYCNLGREVVETTNSISIAVRGTTSIYLAKGDYVDVRVENNRAGGATSLVADAAYNYVNILEIAGSTQTIGSNSIVHMEYTSNTTTTVNTSVTVKPFEDKVSDTHNAYNTSTGLFTVPISGYYQISATVRTANVNLSTSETFISALIVNSVNVNQGQQASGTGASKGHGSVLSVCKYLTKGQTVGIAASASQSTTLSGLSNGNFLTIVKVG